VSPELPADDRRRLLRLARAAIRDRLHGDGSVADEMGGAALPATLREPRGVFVTLKIPSPEAPGGRRLRGCIGTMERTRPLYEAVIDTAPRAALEDPRFTPVTTDELERVRIELSVLSPTSPLADPQALVVGRDGVQLQRGSARAVFLPQVAEEQGWTLEQLLENLALKAGLERGAWRQSELSVFRAEVFGENRAPSAS
jgi:AmmeMemoRadiSam system protein A